MSKGKSKVKKIKESSKSLRKASLHFAGDILNACTSARNTILSAYEKGCAECQEHGICYKEFLESMLAYVNYVQIEAEALQNSIKKEKEEEERVEQEENQKRGRKREASKGIKSSKKKNSASRRTNEKKGQEKP